MVGHTPLAWIPGAYPRPLVESRGKLPWQRSSGKPIGPWRRSRGNPPGEGPGANPWRRSRGKPLAGDPGEVPFRMNQHDRDRIDIHRMTVRTFLFCFFSAYNATLPIGLQPMKGSVAGVRGFGFQMHSPHFHFRYLNDMSNAFHGHCLVI